MTDQKDPITEKLKMTEDLRGKALHRFQHCLRAVNVWLFVWPFWTSWLKAIHEPLPILFGIVHFMITFVLLWILSMWLKKKMSPASAYTWFWMNIWLVVGFFLNNPLTISTRFLSLIIPSVFSYYFWVGINACKILSKLKYAEEAKKH
jgi:hypothetical protein